MCNTEKGCIFAPYPGEDIGLRNEAIYIYPLGVLYGNTFCLFAL